MTWQIASAWAASLVVVIGAVWAGVWKVTAEIGSLKIKVAIIDERLGNHITQEEKRKGG
jgi:hypothetical protein